MVVALLCALVCSAGVVCRVQGQPAPLPVFARGKWGYKDRAGRWVICPQFQAAQSFIGGMAEVWQDDHKFYIDADGRRIEDRNFASRHFSEGLMPVMIGYKYGFADAEGRLVIFTRFDGAGDFSEGLAPAKVGDKWGYVGRDGEMKIAPQFDEASSFSERHASVCHIIKKPKNGDDLTETLVFGTSTSEQCGYIDKSGAFVIAPQFNEANDFSGGLAAVLVGRRENVLTGADPQAGKWGYIDQTGKVVIPLQFQNARDFAEGLAAVKIGAKWGYIDAGGKVVISPRFEWAQSFADGLALVAVGEMKAWWPYRGLTVSAVGLKGEYGYIDKTGEFVSHKMTWKGTWKRR
jgi:hypothetical protein